MNQKAAAAGRRRDAARQVVCAEPVGADLLLGRESRCWLHCRSRAAAHKARGSGDGVRPGTRSAHSACTRSLTHGNGCGQRTWARWVGWVSSPATSCAGSRRGTLRSSLRSTLSSDPCIRSSSTAGQGSDKKQAEEVGEGAAAEAPSQRAARERTHCARTGSGDTRVAGGQGRGAGGGGG